MVNEERLRHMIKMAKFDTNDGEACKAMIQYARKDYVALRMLGSFVMGSIAFVMIVGIWALYSMERLMREIAGMDLKGLIVSMVILYLIFMLIYLTATYIVFNLKYTEGRRKVKKYYGSLKKVNQMYEREERLKMPGNKDWE